MSRVFLILEALEAENRLNERARLRHLRRNLRIQARPMELSNKEFSAQYRLTKELFIELCSELAPILPQSRRSTRVSVECKVLTALSFYATGSYQKPTGMSYLHGLSQASVSKAVKEVTEALNNSNILKKYIQFPQTSKERQIIINRFTNKFGFPGVLGCINGTHIALVRPTDKEEKFLNAKHYYSRNVQIVCDSDLNILNIDATFGGATHNAYIWENSEIHNHMQQLHENREFIWLLGDSNYQLQPWLLTPIINTQPGSAEEYYTNVHCRARNTVTRCIEVLKARWRCLLVHRILHYNHHFVAKIINACAVLHNIANSHRLPVPELTEEDAQRESEGQVRHQPYIEESQELENSKLQRQFIVQYLWENR